MITDKLSNLKSYAFNDSFRLAFDYLLALKGDEPDGTVELDGKRVYAMVQSYDTSFDVPPKMEFHRKYADIQYVFSGSEIIAWAPQENIAVIEPYDESKDAGFTVAPEYAPRLPMMQGRFAVFFPQDAHYAKVNILKGKSARVRKVVVKVAID